VRILDVFGGWTNQKEGNQRVERPAIFVSHSGLLLLFSGLKSSEIFWPTKIIHEAYSISKFFFGPSKPTILLSTEQWKMGPWLFREYSGLYYPIHPNSIGTVQSHCKEFSTKQPGFNGKDPDQLTTPPGFFNSSLAQRFFSSGKMQLCQLKEFQPIVIKLLGMHP